MTEFILALIAFLAAHVVPAIPALRAPLVAGLGRRVYLTLYSILSLALLAWVIVAVRRAPYLPLWDPAPWQWWATLLVMPFALFLLVGGLAESNPLSVGIRRIPAGWGPSGVTAITRHPVLWGFCLWALAHIPPNGDAVALILFGGMAVFALAGMAMGDVRARRRLGDAWEDHAREAPFAPFGSAASWRSLARPPARLVLLALASAALFAWFLLDGHAWLIGLDPLAGL